MRRGMAERTSVDELAWVSVLPHDVPKPLYLDSRVPLPPSLPYRGCISKAYLTLAYQYRGSIGRGSDNEDQRERGLLGEGGIAPYAAKRRCDSKTWHNLAHA